MCVLGLSLLTIGCYNNPEVSERPPGSGDADFHSRPQVGPGTTAGGSTAGPQPAPKQGHGKAQPAHSNPADSKSAPVEHAPQPSKSH